MDTRKVFKAASKFLRSIIGNPFPSSIETSAAPRSIDENSHSKMFNYFVNAFKNGMHQLLENNGKSNMCSSTFLDKNDNVALKIYTKTGIPVYQTDEPRSVTIDFPKKLHLVKSSDHSNCQEKQLEAKNTQEVVQIKSVEKTENTKLKTEQKQNFQPGFKALQDKSLVPNQRKLRKPPSYLRLTAIVYTSFFLMTSSAAYDDMPPLYGCYPCLDLMNREWSYDLTSGCTGTKNDCGKCVEGYFEDVKNEECKLKQIDEIAIVATSNSSRVYAPLQEIIIIQCYFDQAVDCGWFRRGHILEIRGRYSYRSTNNGYATKDCSIKITPFKEIDVGLWECMSLADSSTIAIRSTSVQLLKVGVKYPLVKDGPKNASVMIGGKITMKCTFDEQVQCSWTHNGNKVDIRGRIQFRENERSHTAEDCSIEIHNFDESDAGNWTCSYEGSHAANATFETAFLTSSPLHAPSAPKITIQKSTRTTHSINMTDDVGVIVCFSKRGYPAPQLRWEMENIKSESKSTTLRNGLLFDVEISLNYSEIRHQLNAGENVLKCIVRHEALNNGRAETTYLIMVEGYPEERFSMDKIIIGVTVSVTALIIIIGILIIVIYKKRKPVTNHTRSNEEQNSSLIEGSEVAVNSDNLTT